MINNKKERVVSELLAKKVMLNCVAIFVFMGGLMLNVKITHIGKCEHNKILVVRGNWDK